MADDKTSIENTETLSENEVDPEEWEESWEQATEGLMSTSD